MRRSVPFTRSDFQGPKNCDIEANQCHHYAYNQWLPYSGTFVFDRSQYEIRSAYGALLDLKFSQYEKEPFCETKKDICLIRNHIDEYLKVRDYFTEDFYPLTELSDRLDAWLAVQFDRPSKKDGIVVEAIIRDTALFGKNLVLKRKIFTVIGGDSVTLEDTLVNEGYKTEEYCLLYHINVGYPMLDDGVKVIADVESCTTRTAWAKQNEDTMYEMSAPEANQEETCYFLNLKKPEITLVNPKIGKKFTVSYSGDTLSHFVEWKSMASGDYALGLEPCTTELDGNFVYKTIKKQEMIRFFVYFKVYY